MAGGLAALAIVAALTGVIAADRFVDVRRPDRGLAVEAPASWKMDEREEGLVVRDPLAPFGSAAFVSVGTEAAGDPERALRLALEDQGRLPAGFELGAEPQDVGGWLRRTFVWRMERGELAGFAQARCADSTCLVVLAAAAGDEYGAYLPTLERIAGSARSL